ncbi:MAG: ArsR family transcriptional regulator [Halobacteria archaeon]|nr:ArsR family transcriptional regulator [Halobacteria archaeon]
MTTDSGSTFEEDIRDLPCDAKLAYVVLEKRGPFTEDELASETYLTDDETVYALAVLEEEGLIEKYEYSEGDEAIYEVVRR